LIKAVFFDWFNTLVGFEPPRHEFYQKAFQDFGYDIPLKAIMRGIITGDQMYFAENARLPIRDRSPEGQIEAYTVYSRSIIQEAGIDSPNELPLQVIMSLMEPFKKAGYSLFDDVIAILSRLKDMQLIIGIITNADKHVLSACEKLGLNEYLDFVVTSEEAKAEKPNPAIFKAALARAGVVEDEAVHVGDQYNIDVVGARNAGISPILVDRFDIFPEVTDCVRIQSLNELPEHI